MAARLKLISHKLCPYVQRAVIALTEKGVPFERIDIDLANKPDWFLKISPLGKTPVLLVGEHAIFESAVILEYLEETQANPLHPADALMRKLRAMLMAYREAGGERAIVLVHDDPHGAPLIDALARFGDGLPSHVLPFAVNEITQVGLESIAAAFAYGASG